MQGRRTPYLSTHATTEPKHIYLFLRHAAPSAAGSASPRRPSSRARGVGGEARVAQCRTAGVPQPPAQRRTDVQGKYVRRKNERLKALPPPARVLPHTSSPRVSEATRAGMALQHRDRAELPSLGIAPTTNSDRISEQDWLSHVPTCVFFELMCLSILRPGACF